MLLKAKMVDPKAAQRRLYDSIVTKQLDKLEAAARAASTTDQVRNLPSQSGASRFVRVDSGGCCRPGFDRLGAVSPHCLALWLGWCRVRRPPVGDFGYKALPVSVQPRVLKRRTPTSTAAVHTSYPPPPHVYRCPWIASRWCWVCSVVVLVRDFVSRRCSLSSAQPRVFSRRKAHLSTYVATHPPSPSTALVTATASRSTSSSV